MNKFNKKPKMTFFELNEKLNRNEVLTKKESNVIFAYNFMICLLSALCSVGLLYVVNQIQLLNIISDKNVLLSLFRFVSIVGCLLCLIYFWKLIFLLAFGRYANFKKAFYGRDVQ